MQAGILKAIMQEKETKKLSAHVALNSEKKQ